MYQHGCLFAMMLGDAEEMVELENYVQTEVTATVHDRLVLTCRLGDHNAPDQVTWYRDRCVLVFHVLDLLQKVYLASFIYIIDYIDLHALFLLSLSLSVCCSSSRKKLVDSMQSHTLGRCRPASDE